MTSILLIDLSPLVPVHAAPDIELDYEHDIPFRILYSEGLAIVESGRNVAAEGFGLGIPFGIWKTEGLPICPSLWGTVLFNNDQLNMDRQGIIAELYCIVPRFC
ncbi:MAG: hypothetical protein EZS28_008032 [Streblomastix strix]|uniref:Uncharacterized protein n=1 Tax=Streblomastix strix TaxID=222440 RepID=A0A5J4WPC5_9EUKA|nr:MAG: hypothetical protein EZS28_008032 [Streblomastix strix]